LTNGQRKTQNISKIIDHWQQKLETSAQQNDPLRENTRVLYRNFREEYAGRLIKFGD
jgi:hypothetical protein